MMVAGGEGSRFIVEAKQELNFCLCVIVISVSSGPLPWY